MAKKSRKRRRPRNPATRTTAQPEAAQAPAEPERARARSRRRTGRDEAPQAPWGSFPLVELSVLVALVMLVAGFFASGTRAIVMMGVGLAIGSLAGLEVSIREHLAGYRSHTLILAGFPAILTLGGLFTLADSLSPGVRVAIAAAVFAAGLWLFTQVFRRRSGGAAYRIRGFRG